MAATVGGAGCRYCRRQAGQEHAEGCPVAIGTKVAMAAWVYGHSQGTIGDHFEDWEMRNFHPSRRCGYIVGAIEFDRAENAMYENMDQSDSSEW